jgi:hypothetical protein
LTLKILNRRKCYHFKALAEFAWLPSYPLFLM